MAITWNTGLAAARARHNLKLKKDRIKRFDKALDNFVKQVKAASPKPKAASSKLQAPSCKRLKKDIIK